VEKGPHFTVKQIPLNVQFLEVSVCSR